MADLKKIFGDKVVNKALTRLQDLQEFPRYVVEYLIDNYCKEETFDQDISKVKKRLMENYATPSEAEKLKHKIRQNGTYKLIAKVEARLDPAEDKYWASINAFGERFIHIPERLLDQHPRLLGGMWGVAELGYDPSQISQGKIRPFKLMDFSPFQVARVSLDELIQNRKALSTDQWLHFLISSLGLNPSAYTKRQNLLILARLIPMVERFTNLIELGPRETGKSYIYKHLSYYTAMLSGGKSTRASLFVHMGTGRPGLVAQFDTLVLDEIAHTEFTDPVTTLSIFKDYMEYGTFSVGKHSIKGEAGIVMAGNIDVLGDLPHEKYYHLFEPLPSDLQDPAFFDRIHGYIPGWEMPKLSSSHYADGYGLVMDYLAEVLHSLRNIDVLTPHLKRFQLKNAGGRDEKSIRKILSGLLKLLHPDGVIKDDELIEYLLIATELRQRVRDQLYLMAPGEFKEDLITFSLNGQSFAPVLRERQREPRIRVPLTPVVGKVVGLGVTENEIGMIQLFEVLASKGKGSLFPLGNMGKVMRESLKTAYEYVHHNRKLFKIDNEFKDGYDLSVLALQMSIPKEGPSSGLAFIIGMVSSLSKTPIHPSTAVAGEVTLHGDVLPVGWVSAKILAAKQAGAKRIILPADNQREAESFIHELRDKLEFIFVKDVKEALKASLQTN